MAAPTNLYGLTAYAPTGARIISTFECNTGTHDVKCFLTDADGHFFHDLGDDYTDDDPETVSIDNSVIYCDTKGDLWAEPALKYKDEDGKTVREGLDLPRVNSPNLDLAIGLAVKAERIVGIDRDVCEKDWIDVVNRTSWSNEAQVTQLEAFVREMGLMHVLAAYARRVEQGGL